MAYRVVTSGSWGGFGALTQYSRAVEKLQRILIDNGYGYEVGRVDGCWGLNTDYGFVRAMVSLSRATPGLPETCGPTCNTHASGARSACADCMRQALATLFPKLRGWNLTASEADEIVRIRNQWLTAYIAKYGEHGEYDPAVVMVHEQVPLEEAERIVAERRAEAGLPPLEPEAAAVPVPEGGPTEPRTGGGVPIRRAGVGWVIGILLAAVGIGLIYQLRKGGIEPEPMEAEEEV